MKHLWLLFDEDNGDPEGRYGYGYVWWHRTRRAARNQKQEHERDFPNKTRLRGPVKALVAN